MFENFWVMLASFFVVIFIIEAILSLIKKKIIKEADKKPEQDETWDEFIDELKKDYEKQWIIPFKENQIQVVNKYNHEQLFINDTLVDEKKRTRWYSWIKPYQTLTGVVEDRGQTYSVKVKMGGLVSLSCKVYVGNQLIFKEKITYKLTGGIKEKK